MISATHSVGGKKQLAAGVSEERELVLAEMRGRYLVGSAARGECVYVCWGVRCMEAYVQEANGIQSDAANASVPDGRATAGRRDK